MDIHKAVEEWLIRNKYDGLYNDDNDEPCGCFVTDVAPCGEDMLACEPGYYVKKEGGWRIVPEKKKRTSCN